MNSQRGVKITDLIASLEAVVAEHGLDMEVLTTIHGCAEVEGKPEDLYRVADIANDKEDGNIGEYYSNLDDDWADPSTVRKAVIF